MSQPEGASVGPTSYLPNHKVSKSCGYLQRVACKIIQKEQTGHHYKYVVEHMTLRTETKTIDIRFLLLS